MRSKRHAMIAAAVLVATGIGLASVNATNPASARTPELWDSYTNARFGYQLCYPSGVFSAQPEAANGDGRQFVAVHGGAAMRVWGSNNATDDTLDSKMNAVQIWSSDPDPRAYPRINFKQRAGDHYVVTGNSLTEDFYEKTYLSNGTFVSLQIRYPQKDARYWKAMLPRIANCFKPARS